MGDGKIVQCHCGNHFIPVTSPNLVVLGEKHWHVRCALQEALESNCQIKHEMQKYRDKLKRLVAKVAKVQCALCENPVGESFKFYGSAFYCVRCWHDDEIGGEA